MRKGRGRERCVKAKLVKAVADMVDGDLDWCAGQFQDEDGNDLKGFYAPLEIDTGDQDLECPPKGAVMTICHEETAESAGIQSADCPLINSDTFKINLNNNACGFKIESITYDDEDELRRRY